MARTRASARQQGLNTLQVNWTGAGVPSLRTKAAPAKKAAPAAEKAAAPAAEKAAAPAAEKAAAPIAAKKAAAPIAAKKAAAPAAAKKAAAPRKPLTEAQKNARRKAAAARRRDTECKPATDGRLKTRDAKGQCVLLTTLHKRRAAAGVCDPITKQRANGTIQIIHRVANPARTGAKGDKARMCLTAGSKALKDILLKQAGVDPKQATYAQKLNVYKKSGAKLCDPVTHEFKVGKVQQKLFGAPFGAATGRCVLKEGINRAKVNRGGPAFNKFRQAEFSGKGYTSSLVASPYAHPSMVIDHSYHKQKAARNAKKGPCELKERIVKGVSQGFFAQERKASGRCGFVDSAPKAPKAAKKAAPRASEKVDVTPAIAERRRTRSQK